ncbi:MAG: cyclase family protein [Candidatus Gracilibacteria bacterium]
MEYIDLTHTFKKVMPVYPDDPESELEQVAFIDEDGCNGFQVKTGMHVGTHMDAPLHMLKNGKRLSEYSPEYFFGKGHLIDARGKPIDVDLLDEKTISPGEIVLIMTGFYKKFGTSEYYESYPEITEAFALKMIELQIKLVGMDTPGPDRPPFAIHKLLLGKDVLIIENLTNLESLLGCPDFTIVALPAKFDTEAAPTRVIAQVA